VAAWNARALRSILRRVTAILKAYGVAPTWKLYNWTALTPECHEHFRRITLHRPDLWHEYASRLVEQGVPLAQVRDLLGHASITTTERYDNQKLENLQIAAAKLRPEKRSRRRQSNPTSLVDQGSEDWLAARDDFRPWLIQLG
jgi:integrase